MQPLVFPTPARQVVEVSIGDAKYKLYEPSGGASDSYKRALANCTKVEDGKVSVIDPGAAIDAGKLFLSKCLKTEDGKEVALDVIQEWPSSVGDALVEALLDFLPKAKAEDEETVKNSPGATTAGSV